MNKNPYYLSVLSGVLLALSFPPIPLFFLIFIAFVPLLHSIATQGTKRKYLLIYITFFIYHTGANWWIGSWTQDSDPYLTASSIVLAFLHPFFFMIPFAIFFQISKKISKNIGFVLFPFLWVTFEWFHNLGELSYPWLTIGNTQIYNIYWVQFIDITGVWGASFLIVVVNMIFLRLFNSLTEKGLSDIFRSKENVLSLAIIISIVVLPMIYGYFRINEFEDSKLREENPSISVGLVQPAINPWRKWEISVDGMIDLQTEISDSLLNSAKKPDLVIWNETAIPRYIIQNSSYTYDFLSRWVLARNTSILTGFAELKYYNEENKTVTSRKDETEENTYYEAFNACLLLNPNDLNKLQVYEKMRLTPMAERLPYSEYLLFMRSWFEWGVGISAWGIGKEQHNLVFIKDNDTTQIGPIICIESIYPEFVSKTTKNGAEIIVVITNDAWYDNTPGPEQHYLISAMRAIENRRYVARCANTGVTGLISPTGKTIERLNQYERLGLSIDVPKLQNKSLYVRFGDWFGYLSGIITIVGLAYSIIKVKLLDNIVR